MEIDLYWRTRTIAEAQAAEKQRPWLHEDNQGLRLERQWGWGETGVAALLAQSNFPRRRKFHPLSLDLRAVALATP
jgi:hypothetical protein